MDPEQTVPIGAILSGFTLFAIYIYIISVIFVPSAIPSNTFLRLNQMNTF